MRFQHKGFSDRAERVFSYYGLWWQVVWYTIFSSFVVNDSCFICIIIIVVNIILLLRCYFQGSGQFEKNIKDLDELDLRRVAL